MKSTYSENGASCKRNMSLISRWFQEERQEISFCLRFMFLHSSVRFLNSQVDTCKKDNSESHPSTNCQTLLAAPNISVFLLSWKWQDFLVPDDQSQSLCHDDSSGKAPSPARQPVFHQSHASSALLYTSVYRVCEFQHCAA